MTHIRVPALACDHGWEVTDGCPAVFSDGVREPMTLAELATAAGWSSRNHPKGYGAQHYCPKHIPDGQRE